MKAVVRKLEKIPMGLDTITNAAPKNTRVVVYDRVSGNRKQFFKGADNVICLYQMHNDAGRPTEGTGHFALIMRDPKTQKVSYFSSYGLDCEAELAATHSKGKLLNILGKTYEWSRTPLQSKRNTATCGLWCLARAYLSKLSNSQFAKLMTGRFNASTPDDLVSVMTLILVHTELE